MSNFLSIRDRRIIAKLQYLSDEDVKDLEHVVDALIEYRLSKSSIDLRKVKK